MEQTAPSFSPRLHWQNYFPLLCGLLVLTGGLILSDDGALLRWTLQGLAHAWLPALLLPMLYLAPGLATLRLLWPRGQTLALPAYLSLAAGVSVALPPLLLLLFEQLHVPWNGFVTWGYLLCSLVLAAWPTHPDASWYNPRQHKRGLRWPWYGTALRAVDLALLGVVLPALLIRLYVVRDLPTGMFGDSYHHTMIAQLLVENSGLFQSWQPYVPLATFTYHFGFHTNVAFVHWLTGIDVVSCVLWTGQILNTLSVLLAFTLVVALGGSKWAGIWAALLTGFALTLPGFFVNWGRYTQLTGQVVLVPVVVSWIALAESVQAEPAARSPSSSSFPAPSQRRGGAQRALLLHSAPTLLLVALLTTAMILTHYRVTLFAALFVGSYLVTRVLVQRSGTFLATLLLKTVLATLLALVFASPWFVTIIQGYLIRNTTAIVTNTAITPERFVQAAQLPAVHPFYLKHYVIAAALAGLLVAGWQRQWRIALLALWWALLVLCVTPYAVGLPGAGVIDFLTAFSALYLVAAPLAGYLLAQVQAGIWRALVHLRIPAVTGRVLVSIVMAGAMLVGFSEQTRIVDLNFQLVTPADMQAMQWIRAHTHPQAHFLVNSFPAYGGTLIAGSDAGWWLPLLTGRSTNLPPISYGSEVSADPYYLQQLHTLVEQLRGHPLRDLKPVTIDLTTPEALQVLHDAHVAYIYSGAHANPTPSRADHIDTTLLRNNRNFQLVYDQDGVEIFRSIGIGAP